MELAKLIEELEPSRIQEKEGLFVRKTDDGSCRRGCGERFGMKHDKRRAHEVRCPARPRNAVAVPDKQRGFKGKLEEEENEAKDKNAALTKEEEKLQEEEEAALRRELSLGSRWAFAGLFDTKPRYWAVTTEELGDWLKLARTSRTLQTQLREQEDLLKKFNLVVEETKPERRRRNGQLVARERRRRSKGGLRRRGSAKKGSKSGTLSENTE